MSMVVGQTSPGGRSQIRSVAIVVPAHNEEALIAGSLEALARAITAVDSPSLSVRLLVVLDSCHDRTEQVVRGHGVDCIRVDYRNVGAARAAGFHFLTSTSQPAAAEAFWFSSTDADTRVDPAWLREQVRLADLGADAVFGVVDVDDWSARPDAVRDRFMSLYDGTRRTDPPGHCHVHGASMGVRASAYHRVGGFTPLSVGEDQALSDRLDDESGLLIIRSTAVRATTSARSDSRAPRGFGAFLSDLDDGPTLAALA